MRFNSIKQRLSNGYLKAGVAVASVLPAAAMAQAPADPFAAAQTELTTRIGTYGAGLVAVSVVGVGFMVAVKYVKKLKGAA